MDAMNCFPELKGYYIVIDNPPVHTFDQNDEMIVAGGTKVSTSLLTLLSLTQ